MRHEIIPIEGMHCAMCAKSVERVVGTLPGVSVASVNFATEKLAITWDAEQTGLPDIQDAIRTAGYRALVDETAAAPLAPAHGPLRSVSDVHLSPMKPLMPSTRPGHSATGTHHSAVIGQEAPAAPAAQLSHAAPLAPAPDAEAAHASARKRDTDDRRTRLIVAVASALPLLYLSMVTWPACHFLPDCIRTTPRSRMPCCRQRSSYPVYGQAEASIP